MDSSNAEILLMAGRIFDFKSLVEAIYHVAYRL